jgi:hypothetical protein
LHKFGTIIHGAILALGIAFSLYILRVAFEHYVEDPALAGDWRVTPYAVVGTAWLAIGISYAIVLVRRGFSFLAPIVYVLTCAFVGITLLVGFQSAAKGAGDETTVGIMIVVDVLIVFLGVTLIWNLSSWKTA